MQFSIAKPEEVGVSSAALSQTLDYLAQRRVALHSLLVMRHDALICEGYAAPFTKDTLHRMYSETKSLVSLAVGVMCAKGISIWTTISWITLPKSSPWAALAPSWHG